MSSVVGINRRARSAAQKGIRRQAVIEAAEAHFLEVGYEAFSMSQLARKAGVAKGTLYLYFTTREELFLTLYEQSLDRWSQVFLRHLSGSLTSKQYAQALYATAMADGTFVPLLIRLEHVIEHNVSIESLIQSKRTFIRQVETLAIPSAASLSLSLSQATEVVRTMGVLLIGATTSDQRPMFSGEDMPADIENLINSFSSEPLFVKNAARIIEGIRAEAED